MQCIRLCVQPGSDPRGLAPYRGINSHEEIKSMFRRRDIVKCHVLYRHSGQVCWNVGLGMVQAHPFSPQVFDDACL